MAYTVKIPNPENNNFIEKKFNNVKEIAKYLEIGENTVYAIINGKCLYDRPSTLKIKDVTIVKDSVNHINYNPTTVSEMKLRMRENIKKMKEEISNYEKEQKNKLTEQLKQNLLLKVKQENIIV